MNRSQYVIAPRVRVISGREIPTALFGQLRRPLERVFIVTPFLEDYEFFGKGPLSKFVFRQLAEGAEVTMLTMPPEGTNGTNRAFSRKYNLMRRLSSSGVEVLFNPKLHAKVFLFDESKVTKASILGSANLTRPAMDERLEIAVLTHSRSLFDKIMSTVHKFKKDDETTTFAKWKIKHILKIRSIVGEE